MPHAPVVSVIIAVHDTEEYLAECLDSVLGQSFADIEVLCVDDGSTDGSAGILRTYAARDPRVQVISLDSNHGPGFARNRAIEVARGRYLAIVDSDDVIHEDFVRDLLAAAEADQADVVMCPMAKFSASGGQERYALCTYDSAIPQDLDGRAFTWRELEDVFELRFASCNKLYRRSFLDEHGIRYAEGRFYEDMVFSFRCLFQAERLRLVRRALYLNRRQRQAATTYAQGGRVIDAVPALEELQAFLASDDAYRVYDQRFAAFRLQRLTSYLHKNDAEHMPAFFAALKEVAADPALDGNPYLSEGQQETRQAILTSDLQSFLIRELWRARTSHGRVWRQRAQLRIHNERLKARIDRSRLLPLEEQWRRTYGRRLRRPVRFVQRRINSVRRRLPAWMIGSWKSAEVLAPAGASAGPSGGSAPADPTVRASGSDPRLPAPRETPGAAASTEQRVRVPGHRAQPSGNGAANGHHIDLTDLEPAADAKAQ